MIFSANKTEAKLYPIDMLGFMSITYLIPGIIYGYNVYGQLYPSHIISFASCMCSWAFFRKKSGLIIDLDLRKSFEAKALFVSFVGILSILVFYAYVGPSYFLGDKIERSESISTGFALRIPFYAGAMLLFVSLCGLNKRYRGIKLTLICMIVLVSLVEGARELFIISAFLILVFIHRSTGKSLIPSGVFGFLLIVFMIVFVTVFFKPLFYLIFLGEVYDGGWFNFGEVVNWVRWSSYAVEHGVDLADVQRNDLLYGLQAIFFPFSYLDSSSLVWFHDVLGETDKGRTFGYSGVLWLTRWFGEYFIFIPWFLLFYLYRLCGGYCKSIPKLIVALSLCMVSYRFFRSEWVLVEKTLLWNYLYPTLLFFFVCVTSLRDKKKRYAAV